MAVAAIPMIIAAVSAAVSAVSAIQQGNAAKKAADFNATVAYQNAAISRENAAAQAAQEEKETYMRLGTIRANQGRAGGDAGQGSVLDVLGQVASERELERQNILYQGELQARGYTNTGNLEVAKGKQAKTASYWAAGSSLLKGASSAFGGGMSPAGSVGGMSSTPYTQSGYADF